MPAFRPTLRSALLVVLVSASLAVPAAARVAGQPPAQIVFPVIGTVSYRDDFGEPRAGGPHPGNDILADKRAPVVAVEPGKIVFWTHSATAGCMLYLYGKSGTTYQYIHLNNDLTDRNDNRGKCVPGVSYAPGLKDGMNVVAGELIGYVGDSGDANGLHPHLHFELHPNDGGPVSPYKWLQSALHLTAPTTTPLGPVGEDTDQPVVDDQVLARGGLVPALPLAGDQVLARGGGWATGSP
jgi:murein DD-endopeptidase MepM/ murein hydrolase activator NlpD